MNIRSLLISGSAAVLAALPSPGFAAAYYNKIVGQLQASYASADCFYFTLEGVTEADPVVPGNPWFAIARTQYGAKDAYAALLTAKVTGQTVLINTNGTLSCGYPTAYAVTMQ